MATAILRPTQVTVPASVDTYYPTAAGDPIQAGFSNFSLLIDTSAMPATNHFEIAAEGLISGVWTQLSGGGVDGGTHAAKGGGTTNFVTLNGAIPQGAEYPSSVRIHTWGGNAASVVTVSGSAT